MPKPSKKTRKPATPEKAHVEATMSIEGADRDPLGALRGFNAEHAGHRGNGAPGRRSRGERRCTWAEIGDALGITRQSAWERFSRTEASGAVTDLDGGVVTLRIVTQDDIPDLAVILVGRRRCTDGGAAATTSCVRSRRTSPRRTAPNT